MKIFSVSQIKAWDQYTILHEPISSINLMERAAIACCGWIIAHYDRKYSFKIFCGKGNNGGDGLAIARLLIENLYPVTVYIFGGHQGSFDFEKNFKRLSALTNEVYFPKDKDSFPPITNDIVVDALFGTGLNQKPSGIFADLIEHINQNATSIIAVDMPSGLFADQSSHNNKIINSTFTLSFQTQKLAFLMAENAPFSGKVFTLDIGLSDEYRKKEKTFFELVDKDLIREIYKPRKPFAHKGNYGYACLLAGSNGMMGAAVLSARACMRSGAGKLNCYIPVIGYDIMQSSVPEAMCTPFGNKFLKNVNGVKNFDAIGIGPGIGKHASHKDLLQELFKNYQNPMVIDADALNVLSRNRSLYQLIPAGSILTPHPKEFERLFGKSVSDFDMIHLALKKSKKLNIYIILKGHHSFIATPEGKGYFNTTGNAGMATAGSGDVLTGIITGLLAQKYSSLHACILGVYLHGLAGDIAAEQISKEALIAGDIIRFLGDAFKEIF